MNTSKITNPDAKSFIEKFLGYKEVNRVFYQLVSEEKFNYRMVNIANKRSDSPRESLAHQINLQRSYIKLAKLGGIGKRSDFYDTTLSSKTKSELLKEFEMVDKELIYFLSNPSNLALTVSVKYSKSPVSLVRYLTGLIEHETLHTGWNLAIMDHLNIERFPELKQIWG